MGIFLLLLTTFIWGTAFLAQKLGTDNLAPFGLTVFRNILGGFFLLACIFIRNYQKNKKISSFSTPELGSVPNLKGSVPISEGSVPSETGSVPIGYSCWAGVCSGVPLLAAMVAQQIGIESTTPGISAFLTTNYVLIVPIAASLIYRKSPAWTTWLAAIFALAGTYLICLNGGIDVSKVGKGEAWTILCAVLFSAQMLIVDYFAKRCDVLIMSCTQLFVAALVGAPFLMMPSERALLTLDHFIAAIPVLLYLGVLSSGIAYTLQNYAQSRVSPALAAVLLSTESVFGALSGYVVLGDRMSGFQFAGCAIVLLAVLIAQVPVFLMSKRLRWKNFSQKQAERKGDMDFKSIFGIFRNKRMDKSQLAILRVSMLVAALDGNVSDAELKEFQTMAMNSEGYTPEETDRAFSDTLRSAGYLMLLTRVAERKQLLDAFVAEAETILPAIVDFSKDEINKAVEIWKQMANADKDYSPIEREAIVYLERFLISRNELQAKAFSSLSVPRFPIG